VLEERKSDTEFVEKAPSAITFPPTPLAINHPDLKKMVDLSLVQFKRGWLHDVDSVSIAFSPPWGNAWKFPIGTLEGDEVKELVEWELQQRLHVPLQNHIYAWSRVNGDAYAVVIRPELLSYWENLIQSIGLELRKATIKSGLMDPSVENEADLLPLLHLWNEQGGELSGGELSVDVSDVPAPVEDLPADDEKSVDEEQPAESDESTDEELFFPIVDKPGRSYKLALTSKYIIPAVAVVLLLGTGWIFRDSILNLFANDQGVQQPVAEVSDPALQPEPPVSDPVSNVDINTSVSGTVLGELYSLASAVGVELVSVVLQGSDLLIESTGSDSETSEWRSALAGSISLPIDRFMPRDAEHYLSFISLPPAGETELTVIQFDQWASELGMTVEGRRLYSTNASTLDGLFAKMQQSGARPWRLSIHQSGSDSYLVMMLP